MTHKVTKPIALDESFRTTGLNPQNIADVLANKLDAIKSAIENGGSGEMEAAFECHYNVTSATDIYNAMQDKKVPFFYQNGVVAQLWKVETNKYTFRTTSTRVVEGENILDIVDYIVNGSVWSTATKTISGGSSTQQAYLAKVKSSVNFDTTGLSGMQSIISVNDVPADGVYQLSIFMCITPKTASSTKSDLVFQFTGTSGTGMPNTTFHAVVDDSQTFGQQLSFSTTLNLKAGTNSLKLRCGGLNTEYFVFVDDLTVAQLVNGVYHNGDNFDEVHILPEAADFNNDDGVLVDGATGGPRFMLWQTLANKVLGFIKSLPTTITAFRSGDVIPVDGPSGTAKMSKDDLLRETAENTKNTFYDTPELPLNGYDGFYAIGSVGNDAKNFRLGDNLKLVYNMLQNYHKDLVVVDNDEQTTLPYYIYVSIDIKAGETYLIKLNRSFGRNADIKLQSRDVSRQAVEDIGYLKANETEHYFVFSPTQNAKYICIFDTSNDGAKYTTDVFVNKDVFVETGYNLFGYYPHTKSIVRGARFGNATFPTIQSSNSRLTIENLVEMPVNSYCTINLSGYQFSVIQSTKDDGTGQFADSGWKSPGTLVKVLYKYQSFNIRKADNTSITAEELALAKNNIKFVINEVSEEKGVKLPDYYLYKDEMIKSAKSNFINRNTFTLANHATTNFAGASSNTEQSTHFSANRGFKCVENDIRITSDGHFVLSHSNDMREGFVNNDGTEIADAVIVENSTLSDLKTNYKSKVGGYRICTLDEQLAICKSRNMCMVAEVKDFEVTQLDSVLEVVALCKNYLGYENFVLTSFNEQLLDLVRSNDVSVTLLYITYRNDKPDLDKLAYSFGNSALYLDYYSVAKYDGIDRGYDEYIEEATEKGVPLAAWTLEMDDVAKVSKEGKYKLIATNYSATGDLCGTIASSYNGRKQNWEGYVSGQPQWHNGTVVGDTLVLAQNQSFSYSFSGVVNAKIVARIVFEGTLNIDNNYHNVTELLGAEFESGCYEIVLSVGKTTNFTSLQIKNNDAGDAVIRDLEIYLVEC